MAGPLFLSLFYLMIILVGGLKRSQLKLFFLFYPSLVGFSKRAYFELQPELAGDIDGRIHPDNQSDG